MDDTVEVLYPDGTAGDLASLQARYGAGIRVLRSPQQHAFRLRKINVRNDGITNLVVWVMDRDGRPKVGQPTTYSYANLESPSADLPLLPRSSVDRWTERGILQKNRCDGAGRVEYQIGANSWIKDGRGPYAMFVLDPAIGSDCIDGLGWEMGTNHHGPVEVFFYEEDGTVTPPPGEDADQVPALAAQAARIADALERLVKHFGA